MKQYFINLWRALCGKCTTPFDNPDKPITEISVSVVERQMASFDDLSRLAENLRERINEKDQIIQELHNELNITRASVRDAHTQIGALLTAKQMAERTVSAIDDLSFVMEKHDLATAIAFADYASGDQRILRAAQACITLLRKVNEDK